MRLSFFNLWLVIAALLTTNTAQAATYYWDANGTTAGLGNTAGTWGAGVGSAFLHSFTATEYRSQLYGTLSTTTATTASGDFIYFGTVNLALGSTASTIGIDSGGVTSSYIVFGAGQGSQGLTLSGGGGTITLGTTPNIVANNTGINTIRAVLTGTNGLTYSGPGTLTLTGVNSYTNTTTINSGGTLNVGNGSTGSLFSGTTMPLTFSAGGGLFNVAEAAGSSQSLGALTFSAGEGTVISTAAGSSSAATLTFASLAARTAGASGNLSLAVNTTSTGATPNKIVLTGATSGTLLDKGLFFGGNNYAAYDASGYARAYTTSDAKAYTSPGAPTLAVNDATTNTFVTGTISAQTTASVNTINLAANNLTFQNTASTLSVNGILSAGASSAYITNGTSASSIQTTAGGGELVVRVNGATDGLNIGANIVNHSTSTLTKSGAGTLTLSGANTYAGTTTINAGTLALSGGSALPSAAAVVLANAPGATLLLTNNNQTIGTVSGGGFAGGNVNVGTNTLTLGGASSGMTFSGQFIGATSGGVTKTGTGTLILPNANSFAGTLTLSAGKLEFDMNDNEASNICMVSTGGQINMANNTTIYFNAVTGGGGTAQQTLGQLGWQGTSGFPRPFEYGMGNAINVTTGTAFLVTGGTTAGGNNNTGWRFSGNVTGSSTGNAILAITPPNNGQSYTFTGIMADGSGGTLGLNITNQNAQFTSLSGANTFTGPILMTNTSTTATSYLVIGGERNESGSAAGTGYIGGGNYNNTIYLGSQYTILDYMSSANQTLGGVISGAGALLKEGSGTLTLTNANTYTGTNFVSAGTLLINGNSIAVNNRVTVNAGATLGGLGTIGGTVTNQAGSTLAVGVNGVAGTLTLTNGLGLNGAYLSFILTNANAGAYSQLVVTNGTFVANGVNFIQPINANSSIPAGTYMLITNVNNRTGSGSFVFYQSGATNWNINGATLTIITNANAVLLTVSGSPTNSSTGTLYWQGGVSSAWDTSTLNWLNVGPVAYADTANVIFADNATSYTVSGGFSPSPASITFSNVNNNYTVSSAIQGAGTLTKLNSQTLTLSGANTYSGATTVSAGTLALAGSGSLANSSVTVSGGTFTEAATATISGATVTNAFYGTSATLSNANTYAGGTIWGNPASANAAGILALGNNAALGTGPLMIRNNSATTPANSIQSADSTARTITNSIIRPIGATSINFNTAGNGDLNFSGPVNLNGGSWTFNIANNFTTLSGIVSGNSGDAITKAGVGTLVLNNANTYNGGTTLSTGLLETDNNAALGTGLLLMNGGALSNNVAGITLTNPISLQAAATVGVPAGTNFTLSGIITNSSATNMTKLGAGTLTLNPGSGNTNSMGSLAVDGGTLSLTSGTLNVTMPTSATTGSTGPGLIISGSGSTLSIAGGTNNTLAGYACCINNGGTLTISSGTFSAGSELLNAYGSAGTINLNGGLMSLWQLRVSHSPNQGTVNLNGGTLQLAYINNSSSGGTVNLNGSTLQPTAGSTDFMGANSTYKVQAGGAIFNTAGFNITNNAPLIHDSALGATPDGGLTKLGTGTLTLTATNTYTGPTLISAGTLALSGGALITNSASIVVASSAIFNVSGLTSAFTLQQSTSQTLSNSAPGAIINGTNNCSAGTLSLVYDGVNPSFIITNGGMTLSSSTVLTINNTGTPLAAGSYTLITNTTASNAGYVTGAVTSPVTVGGNGASGTATLAVSANKLVLTVAASVTASATTNLVQLASGSPVYGNTLTFSATVYTNGSIAGDASSNYVFSVDGTPAATNNISSGTANFSISSLTAATHTINAVYSGDTNYLSSTNSFGVTVAPRPVAITGTRAYDGTALATNTILTIANSVGTDNVTNYLQGNGSYATLSSANVGTNSIIATNALALTGGVGTNYTLVGASGSVVITQAVATYTAGVSLVSSSPTNGYLSSVNFTSVVPAYVNSGSVIFLATNGVFGEVISTNGITNGIAYSLAITNLPRGTNIITAQYAGDANVLGWTNSIQQVTTNHPPVAGADSLSWAKGTANKDIAITDLLANDTDADGDTLTLISVDATSANGVVLTTNATYVQYTGALTNNDSFSYTISDGFGGTATALVSITATNSAGAPGGSITTGGGPVTVVFFGITGDQYEVQRSTNLTTGVWISISTNTAPDSGAITNTDSFSDLIVIPAAAYYRLITH